MTRHGRPQICLTQCFVVAPCPGPHSGRCEAGARCPSLKHRYDRPLLPLNSTSFPTDPKWNMVQSLGHAGKIFSQFAAWQMYSGTRNLPPACDYLLSIPLAFGLAHWVSSLACLDEVSKVRQCKV